MNRRHSADDYRRLIDRFSAARPDMAFSSDFIVGHPGEDEADFSATLALAGSSLSFDRLLESRRSTGEAPRPSNAGP